MTRTNRTYVLAIDQASWRQRRWVVAACSAGIVLFNILAVALVGAAARAETRTLGDLGGDRIIVCTGFGMVALDRDGKPIDSSGDQRQSICPFCLPMMQGHLDVPIAGGALATPLAGAIVVSSPSGRVPPTPARAVRAAPARAPPLA